MSNERDCIRRPLDLESNLTTSYSAYSRYGKITEGKVYRLTPSNLEWGYYKYTEDKGNVVHITSAQVVEVFGKCPACLGEGK